MVPRSRHPLLARADRVADNAVAGRNGRDERLEIDRTRSVLQQRRHVAAGRADDRDPAPAVGDDRVPVGRHRSADRVVVGTSDDANAVTLIVEDGVRRDRRVARIPDLDADAEAGDSQPADHDVVGGDDEPDAAGVAMQRHGRLTVDGDGRRDRRKVGLRDNARAATEVERDGSPDFRGIRTLDRVAQGSDPRVGR